MHPERAAQRRVDPGLGPETRIRSPGWMRVGALAIGGLTIPLLSYLWAAHDLPSTFEADAEIGQAPVRPRLANIGKQRSLTDGMRQACPDSFRKLPSSYEENPRVVDEIMDSEFIGHLPSAIEDILRLSPTPVLESDAATRGTGSTWRTAHTCVRLLTLRMERLLARAEGDAAWDTAKLQLRFVGFLLEQARSFDELTLAEASQTVLFRSLLSAIDTGRLTTAQLRKLVSLSEPSGLAARLLEALNREYSIFSAEIESLRTQKNGLLSKVVYHPNRTRQAWLAAMVKSAKALAKDDLRGAHDVLRQQEVALSTHEPLVRNSLGQRLMAATVRGYVSPLAQAVDLVAEVRLLRLRSAVALYRLETGRVPASLGQLIGRYLIAIPDDPWGQLDRNFRYSASDRRLYSVGRDRTDDHGLFKLAFSYGDGSNDLGCYFSN